MSRSLSALERLRSLSVDQARAELCEKERAVSAARALCAEREEALCACERSARQAREESTRIVTSEGLLYAERFGLALVLEAKRLRTQVERARVLVEEAVTQASVMRQHLLMLEVKRRTVTHALERVEAERARVKTLREEELAADFHRAQTARPKNRAQ